MKYLFSWGRVGNVRTRMSGSWTALSSVLAHACLWLAGVGGICCPKYVTLGSTNLCNYWVYTTPNKEMEGQRGHFWPKFTFLTRHSELCPCPSLIGEAGLLRLEWGQRSELWAEVQELWKLGSGAGILGLVPTLFSLGPGRVPGRGAAEKLSPVAGVGVGHCLRRAPPGLGVYTFCL